MKDKEKQIFDKYGNYDFPTDLKQESLNTATTQIEEMAKEIHYGYWGNCYNDSCDVCPANFHNVCDDKLIAEKLYEKGYRKITNDLVVLNRDEYNNLIRPTLKSIEYAIAKFAEQEAKKKLIELAKVYGIDTEVYE